MNTSQPTPAGRYPPVASDQKGFVGAAERRLGLIANRKANFADTSVLSGQHGFR